MSNAPSNDIINQARALIRSAEGGRIGPEFLRRKLGISYVRADALLRAVISSDPASEAEVRLPAVSQGAPPMQTGAQPRAEAIRVEPRAAAPDPGGTEPKPVNIRLDEIVAERGVQPRFGLDEETVDRYLDLLQVGHEFPPVTLFRVSDTLVLADGFHRLEAHRRAKREAIPAVLLPGTRRDALLHGLVSNTQHGLPLTPKEKRGAALRLLDDPVWSEWSDREIARHCGLSGMTISRLRHQVHPNNVKASRKCRGPGGQVREMDVSRLGRKRREPVRPAGAATERGRTSPSKHDVALPPSPQAPWADAYPGEDLSGAVAPLLQALEEALDDVLRSPVRADDVSTYPLDPLRSKLSRVTELLSSQSVDATRNAQAA